MATSRMLYVGTDGFKTSTFICTRSFFDGHLTIKTKDKKERRFNCSGVILKLKGKRLELACIGKFKTWECYKQ